MFPKRSAKDAEKPHPDQDALDIEQTHSNVAAPQSRKSISSVFLRLSSFTTGLILLGLVTGPLQARALGPAGRGELAAIFAVSSFLPVIAALGLEIVVARETARGTASGELIGTMGAVTIFVALILAAIGIPFSAWLAHGRSTVHFFILLQFLLLPIMLPLQLLNWALIGRERWSLVMASRAFPILLPALVVIVLYLVGTMTVAAVATATVTASLIGMVPALSMLPRLTELHFNESKLRTALPFALRTWLGTLAALTNGRLDQLLMVGLTSSRQLGLYAVAVTSTSLTGQVVSTLGSPMLSRIAAGERHIVSRATRMTVLIVIMVNVCVAAIVPLAVPLLFGRPFSGAVIMSWILLLAAVPLSITMVLTGSMVGHGKPSIPARGEALTLLITIPGLILSVPKFGGTGAASVSLIAYTADAAYQIQAGRRYFGGDLFSYLVPTKNDISWLFARLLAIPAGILPRKSAIPS